MSKKVKHRRAVVQGVEQAIYGAATLAAILFPMWLGGLLCHVLGV